jgi:hypothetical protein
VAQALACGKFNNLGSSRHNARNSKGDALASAALLSFNETDRLPAVVVAARSTTATAAGSAIGLRAGFIDGHRASIQFMAAQALDGAHPLGVRAHLDESEPFRLARIAIGYDADAIDGSVLLKQRSDRILGRAEAEISYKYILHVVFSF